MTSICTASADSSAPPDAFFARWADVVGRSGDVTRIGIEVSIEGPLVWPWRKLIGRGIARSTPEGLARLVETVEADRAARR